MSPQVCYCTAGHVLPAAIYPAAVPGGQKGTSSPGRLGTHRRPSSPHNKNQNPAGPGGFNIRHTGLYSKFITQKLQIRRAEISNYDFKTHEHKHDVYCTGSVLRPAYAEFAGKCEHGVKMRTRFVYN